MKRFAIIVLILLCTAGLLSACGQEYVYPGSYTVTFVTGVGADFTIVTNGNQIIRMPEDPVRQGYVFGGWFYDEGIWNNPFTSKSLAYNPITEDLTVYAKWNYASAEEAVIADGLYKGSAADEVIGEIIDALALPQNFSATVTDTDGEPFNVSYVATQQGFRLKMEYEEYTEYYAPNAYGYYYMRTEGEEGVYSIVSAEYAASVRDSFLPKAYLSDMSSQISALRDRKAHAVAAHFGEGFLEGVENSVRVLGTVAHINFAYLYCEDNQLYRYTLSAAISASAVEEISITRAVDSRARYAENPSESAANMVYTYGGVIINVPAVTNLEYLGGNISEDEVLVRFDTGTGDALSPITTDAYAELTLPQATLTGRTLAGWYDESGLHRYGGAGDTIDLYNRDITLYAVFEEVLPVFELDGGHFDTELYDVYTYDALDAFVPQKAGYRFTGWYMDVALTVPCENYHVAYTATSTVYAGWALCQKVDFVTNNGKFMPSAYIAPGGELDIDALPAPYKEGYTFVGWCSDAALLNLYAGGSLEGTYTLYAKYTAN